MTRQVITSESVLDILRHHPEGITLPDLIREHWPGSTPVEFTAIRQCIYPKLKQLERYGYAERTTVTDHIQGGHRTTWRAVDD